MRTELPEHHWHVLGLLTGIVLMLAPSLITVGYFTSWTVAAVVLLIIVITVVFVLGLICTIRALDKLGIID